MRTRSKTLARVLSAVLTVALGDTFYVAALAALAFVTYAVHPLAGVPFAALMFGRSRMYELFTDSTAIASGAGRNYEAVAKAAALGKRLDDGRMLHVDGLLAKITLAATVGTTTGTFSGFRVHEWYKIKIAPLGFPVEYSHDLDGASLRMLNLKESRGAVRHTVDAATYASAAGAIAPVVYAWIPFATEDGYEEQDTALAALSLGRGRFRIECRSDTLPTGVTGLSITGVSVWASLFPKWPGVPSFKQRRDEIIPTPTNFKLSQAGMYGTRVAKAFMRVNGGQAAATDHLPGSFEESRTMRWLAGGMNRIEDLRIDTLVQLDNFGQLNDATQESLTVPTHVPVVGASSNRERATKLVYIGGGDEHRITFSGDPRDTATGTGRDVLMVSAQLHDVGKRSKEWNAYCEAIGVDPNEAADRAHKAPTSKAGKVDPAKADALPSRFGTTGSE